MQPNHHCPVAAPDHKPLANRWVDKPATHRDSTIAEYLQDILAHVPDRLTPVDGHSYPMLAALSMHGITVFERRRSRRTAESLQAIAALIHDDADERRLAEYLLRHRDDVHDGRRTISRLIRAARCVAEMDRRHRSAREIPVGLSTKQPDGAGTHPVERTDCDSVADTVVSFLRSAVPDHLVTETVAAWIADATVSAMTLAARHADKGGRHCALVAMRPSARRDARLVTAVREWVPDDRVARDVSRLLIGADGAPHTTALLWWVAQGPDSLGQVPVLVGARWREEISRLSRSAHRHGTTTVRHRRWPA